MFYQVRFAYDESSALSKMQAYPVMNYIYVRIIMNCNFAYVCLAYVAVGQLVA